MAKTEGNLRRLWFDCCKTCRTWQTSHHRRRGGQPVKCPTCRRRTVRITDTAWMEALLTLDGEAPQAS